jgi:hypothetical protein
MRMERGNLFFGDENVSYSFPVNAIAAQQIASFTGIPAVYYNRMREQNPELLDHNINAWFQDMDALRMVRTRDNRARAFLSDKYLPIDNGHVSLDSGDIAANQAIHRKMNEDIRRALESGEEIEGTMTREEYDAVQAERSAGFVDPAETAAKVKLYSATPGAEQANRAAEARQALLDLEADPRMRDREIFYMDEQQEVRKATVSQLLELFVPGRKSPGLDMVNSIMESLWSINATK